MTTNLEINIAAELENAIEIGIDIGLSDHLITVQGYKDGRSGAKSLNDNPYEADTWMFRVWAEEFQNALDGVIYPESTLIMDICYPSDDKLIMQH